MEACRNLEELKPLSTEVAGFFDELKARHGLNSLEIVVLVGWFFDLVIRAIEEEGGNTGNKVREGCLRFIEDIVKDGAVELPQ